MATLATIMRVLLLCAGMYVVVITTIALIFYWMEREVPPQGIPTVDLRVAYTEATKGGQ